MPILPKILPESPDPYIKALGSNKATAALARMAHINALIDQINENTNDITTIEADIVTIQAAIAALTDIEYNNVLAVDPVNGNNTTALANTFNKPYLTLAAAVTAATSGDLIWLRPGNHAVSSNILKDGVNFYADKGATVTSTNNLFNADTTAGGTVLITPVYFVGHAVLTDNNPGGGGFIQINTNPSAAIYLEFDSITSTNNSNAMVIRDGYLNLLCRGNYTSAGRCFNMRDTGNIDAEVYGVVTSTFANNANSIIYSSGHSWNGRVNVKAKAFSLPSPSASESYIEVTGATNGVLNVQLQYITDAVVNSFRFFNAQANTALFATITIGDVSLTNRPLFVVNGAANNVVFELGRGSFVGGSVTAGRVKLNNCDVTPTATISTTGTGLLATRNSTIDCSATVGVSPITTGAGASYYPTATKLVSNGATATISNAAGSVYSAGSAGNVATTAAITAGVFTIDPGFIM